ncbi:2-hydroxyacid dehydrogenase [Pseudoduganella namucuonensis]|uniref:Glyoxylate/hydroxypyruvate reductase A n=1 Tax=Pseudoduganella namucuonensis TaxID=1035707 RepID=A0A1I7K279_9BURK|nr:glyoxylate/hydroxypyruvate reductase A [Pseudoduganella namucuonensis]SFU91517.1 glyoxylate/hydroxypyruvate reductase A [Pseudoduganella namucuonensis]
MSDTPPCTFVYKADPVRGAEWRGLFAELAPEVDFRIWPDVGDPARVRFLAAWQPPADLAAYTGLELLFSVGAGIDQFDLEALPAGLPLVRMVEPGIVGGMVEYATLAVLSIHRDWQTYAAQQRCEVWRALRVRPAASRRVGVLGLGVLGRAVLAQLRGLGFPCSAWSRSQHDVEGVDCYAGDAALPGFAARCDILVCLLPLTDETRGILNARLFERLPAGAALVHAGRGPHLVQQDLLDALDSGQLARAVLDVCDPEPLPPGHPYWEHPAIMLTPHIASMTQPDSAVRAVLENLRRHRAGEPLEGLVERRRGY